MMQTTGTTRTIRVNRNSEGYTMSADYWLCEARRWSAVFTDHVMNGDYSDSRFLARAKYRRAIKRYNRLKARSR